MGCGPGWGKYHAKKNKKKIVVLDHPTTTIMYPNISLTQITDTLK
jgi:hypothetical protein